eukprot:TRINITY_DN8120_c0_g2_i2.p1 TRINITY_DN8120_c0_g2~~TRINITY_DN8120_c0_g2_i2.p1  ORF type:complete len:318 (-),score=30.21 TRINITY_DN8120_c0_g2_i2:287-1240(-)
MQRKLVELTKTLIFVSWIIPISLGLIVQNQTHSETLLSYLYLAPGTIPIEQWLTPVDADTATFCSAETSFDAPFSKAVVIVNRYNCNPWSKVETAQARGFDGVLIISVNVHNYYVFHFRLFETNDYVIQAGVVDLDFNIREVIAPYGHNATLSVASGYDNAEAISHVYNPQYTVSQIVLMIVGVGLIVHASYTIYIADKSTYTKVNIILLFTALLHGLILVIMSILGLMAKSGYVPFWFRNLLFFLSYPLMLIGYSMINSIWLVAIHTSMDSNWASVMNRVVLIEVGICFVLMIFNSSLIIEEAGLDSKCKKCILRP